MSYNAHNIGHLMFDEHLPWFSLMQAFGLETAHMQPLSLQFPDGPTLTACTRASPLERVHEGGVEGSRWSEGTSAGGAGGAGGEGGEGVRGTLTASSSSATGDGGL